jgi:hypothetical protein
MGLRATGTWSKDWDEVMLWGLEVLAFCMALARRRR